MIFELILNGIMLYWPSFIGKFSSEGQGETAVTPDTQ